jgi:hypothetical protein
MQSWIYIAHIGCVDKLKAFGFKRKTKQ